MKVILLFSIIMSLTRPISAQTDSIAIIVNSQNPVQKLSAGQVADFFLKKKREWDDGTLVRFIDYTEDVEDRKTFLSVFVKKTQREVDLYWIGQKLYTGDSAPQQLSSSSMMTALVGRLKGAIGYVPNSMPLPKGVKKVDIGAP